MASKYFTADFETTTKEEDCRVWAVGVSSIDDENKFEWSNTLYRAYNPIEWLFDHMKKNKRATYYFHNLKFDGDFIINELFRLGFKWTNRRKLQSKEFTTLISDTGQFYSMKIKFSGKNGDQVTILDSLKIIPMSVADTAKAFGLPNKKGEIDYEKERPRGYKLDDNEIDYLRNDVEIMSKAIKVLFDEGLCQMTQGSNALEDYKEIIGKRRFYNLFPVLDLVVDSDIRRSYKGGFTYCRPEIEGVDIGHGMVFDVNSLYPSVMRDKLLPFGLPKRFIGKYKLDDEYPLYVQSFTCEFKIKECYLPTIQIKGGRYNETEYLTESDGVTELTLTNVDLKLMLDHYDVKMHSWIGGYMFKGQHGMFKDYIDKWGSRKVQAGKTGNKGQKTMAKLMLNALYGKFALNPKVQSKFPVESEDGVKYQLGEEELRDSIYVPMGSFITSYAREITIRAAQELGDRFLYADTDSLHVTGFEDINIKIDSEELGLWKEEYRFFRARYLRAKTYLEDTIYSKNNKIKMKRVVCCAGMPHKIHKYVTWDNFIVNSIEFEGKLKPKHVKGGTVLVKTPYQIKEK